MRRDDFLLTRLLEIVVHTDDLALSIDVLPPTFPDDAFTSVLELLTRLAVGRHAAFSKVERVRFLIAWPHDGALCRPGLPRVWADPPVEDHY